MARRHPVDRDLILDFGFRGMEVSIGEAELRRTVVMLVDSREETMRYVRKNLGIFASAIALVEYGDG